MIGNVIEKEHITADICNFVFELPEELEFTPGQYVTITFTDKMKRRPFSILDIKGSKLTLCIQKNGEVTKRMFEEQIPFQMEVGKAKGRFVFEEDTKPIIMIAGGVGIVPLYNMILNNDFSKRSISLFYSCKTPEKMAFRDDLQAIPELITYERFTQLQNRFTFEEIMQENPQYLDSYIYICGSLDFVNAFKALAAANDVPNKQIKTEIF